MMAAKRPARPAAVVPVGLALLALGVWSWHAGVRQTQQADVPSDPWERVKEHYPMAQEPQETPAASSKVLAEAVGRATPFSPKRRAVPPPMGAEGGMEGQAEALPLAPVFVYKGHINVGQRPRAIVENTATRKTHFLEVGQEVTGFKVLDITENRVVLSNLKTQEEVVVTL